jgi:predicted alpha/beta hydrolase
VSWGTCDERAVIASEPFRVASTDGCPLAATLFRPRPTRAVKQVVLVCSAMGVRQTFYYDFAEYAAERDRAVITFDYRGVGESAPARLRGFRADLVDWGRRDVAAMIGHARSEFPDLPLSVVAHSVGAQIFGLAPNNGEVRDLLGLGSQSAYWGHWTGLRGLRVGLLFHLIIPVLSPALGYFPARWFGLGQDVPRDVARMWAYWGRHPDYVLGRIGDDQREGYRRFAGRVRAVTASDDVMAPPAAVRAMLDFYPAARREFRLVRREDSEIMIRGSRHGRR